MVKNIIHQKNDLPSGLFDRKIIWNIGPIFKYNCIRCNDLPAFIDIKYNEYKYKKHTKYYRYYGYATVVCKKVIRYYFKFIKGIWLEQLKKGLNND